MRSESGGLIGCDLGICSANLTVNQQNNHDNPHQTTNRQNMTLDKSELEAGQAEKFVRCYDDGGETVDRYTVVFTGRYRHKTGGVFWHLGMNAEPYHPQGFGQHGERDRQIDVNKWGFAPPIGRKNHLGKRVSFFELPDDCRKLVIHNLIELHGN